MDYKFCEVDPLMTASKIRELYNIDEEFERSVVRMFFKTFNSERLKLDDLKKYMKISKMEIDVLILFSEGKSLYEIDKELNWSTGASFRHYVSIIYKLKIFFIKKFDRIYDKIFVDAVGNEIIILKKLNRFKNIIVEKEEFKIKRTSLRIDETKHDMKVEEFIAFYRVSNGETYADISKDHGWPTKNSMTFYKRICDKIENKDIKRKSRKLKSKSKTELSKNEERVDELVKLGHTSLQISEKIGLTLSAVKDTRKRISRKMKLIEEN